ncbi:MAG TPA: 1-(5-phosphoribosyl)-5-[(5-phosphoribosylamino)methylideneamino]imidazole-4-carboxamide isomerase [Elusimicrobia bacterium]|nr:MAG: 1-(5-phosphoribosyl)-5-[(5-phosphoribosylamino)methylideneamino]imidazole-4-carboxamide isomerase [Elusimicrobia bacterium RIFOXYA12_FULL_49_49]OGS11891.1 MAG: 1-(5-phosphoribosyl)-5-[(5-phosphoribosylamino)methylideneamino]imidazole-4-carboxamide isomerase [Elusimicrobia bacterium RIFOXYB1_FULL_48_9]OGS16847.1 MAG: 1-(5-phosphoribosyl)-5-[(5-phosphoribosylamino)methylideneamino]imidazole-4-carboxamide isomerase [Elusimicrobia bacterium RIFOXYA2_FULL_47_53]OGS32075.1 MAG: 1-(5-phosphorib
MLIIPAIDIRAGNCVMLKQGKIDAETVYSKDPVFMAKLWQAKGASRLHVVDLDGAFGGSPQNLEIIKRIRAGISIPIQLGGGVRSLNTIDTLFDIGIDRIIVGTLAIYNPDIIRQAIEKHGRKLIVAVDVVDNKVAIGGWKETTSVEATDLAVKLKDMGIEEILSTDVKKDGMMEGPNIEGLRLIAKAARIGVIASGGISSLDDIRKLKEYEKEGIMGAVIGKALYTDAIKLEEAIKIGGK